MIFIFDWGHLRRNEIGPLAESDFKNGGDDEHFFMLLSYSEWFRAFFIPTIPTKRWYALRDMESQGETAVDKHFFEKYKALAELNQAVANNKINEDEYRTRRDKL